MADTPKPLDRVAELAHAAQTIDHLADAVRTVAGLRSRARAARAKATANRHNPVRRIFWTWRANLLTERADRLAVERGVTVEAPQ
jgi:hypothetical protein